MLKKKTIGLLTASLLLAACNGGGGGSGGPAGSSGSSIQGVLVDSAIEGVFYETESDHGLTDAQGRFECRSGEVVEFSLPASNNKRIYLGELPCRKVISPIEIVTNAAHTIDSNIADLSPEHQQGVKNVLRLIQSFDSRSDVEGIQINADEMADLADYLESMDVDIENDGMDGLTSLSSENMSIYLNNLMTAVGRPADVVSESDALIHFAVTQSACSIAGCPSPSNDDDEVVAPSPSIAQCLTGKTFSTIYPEGEGYVGGKNLPINYRNGSVILMGESSNPAWLFDTLFVLYTNGSAKMFRKKDNYSDPGYYYEFKVGGWKNPLTDDLNSNGVVDVDDVTELEISNVHFNDSRKTLYFMPMTHASWRDLTKQTGMSNIFGAVEEHTAHGGGFETLEFTIQSSCSVPTATEIVE
jgi:hypothetical protein